MERLWLRDRERVTSADPVAVVGAGCQLATLHRMPAAKRRHGSASDRRDTPPVDVFFGVTAGLLARRSSPLPVFPTPCGISDLKKREQLTAYSCGGSAGISRARAIHRLPS